MAQAQWYFVENGQRIGPVAQAELAEMAEHGMISPETLVWADGMKDWEEARAHFDFAAAKAGRTPPATTPPPVQSAPPDDMGFPLSSQTSGSASGSAGPAGQGVGPDGLYVGAPSRGFGEAISVCLGKYVTFSGRASRSEYWFFYLFIILISIAATIVDSFLFGLMGGIAPVNAIVSLAVFLPSLAVTWRRLHDIGRSGWWVGAFYIALLVMGGFAGVAASGVAYGGDGYGGLGILAVFGVFVVIYTIVMIVFLCTRGMPSKNAYG